MRKISRKRRNNMPKKQLRRSLTDSVLEGVCGGIAQYFGFPSIWLRGFIIVSLLFSRHALIIGALYTLLAVLIPRESVQEVKGRYQDQEYQKKKRESEEPMYRDLNRKGIRKAQKVEDEES